MYVGVAAIQCVFSKGCLSLLSNENRVILASQQISVLLRLS